MLNALSCTLARDVWLGSRSCNFFTAFYAHEYFLIQKHLLLQKIFWFEFIGFVMVALVAYIDDFLGGLVFRGGEVWTVEFLSRVGAGFSVFCWFWAELLLFGWRVARYFFAWILTLLCWFWWLSLLVRNYFAWEYFSQVRYWGSHRHLSWTGWVVVVPSFDHGLFGLWNLRVTAAVILTVIFFA